VLRVGESGGIGDVVAPGAGGYKWRSGNVEGRLLERCEVVVDVRLAESVRDQTRADLLDVGPLKVAGGGQGEGNVRVGLDLAEPEQAKSLWKAATQPEVGAALGEEGQEAVADAVCALFGRGGGGRAGERLEADVEVFDEEPAAWAKRLGHPSKRFVSFREVGENEPGVNEVVAVPWRLIARHVVLQEVVCVRAAQPGGVDVGGHDDGAFRRD
jgi:hypothetical protein